MKIFVTRSSEWRASGTVKEFEDLDSCINTLLETEDFGDYEPEVIVSKVSNPMFEKEKECEYAVEIYDTWRE